MVQLIKISRFDLPELILLAYDGDVKLLNKYHIKKFNYKEDAVKKELELIDNMSKKIPLDYFKVVFDNKPIGYVVKSGRFLYSFALAIQYRKKEIKDDWWEAVKDNLGKDLTCGLFSNNTRALLFLKNKGMKIFMEHKIDNGLTEIYLKN